MTQRLPLPDCFEEVGVRKQRTARVHLGVQDTNRLAEVITNDLDRRKQIGIIRYQDGGLEVSQVCIIH